MTMMEEQKAPAKKASKFMQPKQVSAALAAVIGSGPFPRTEATKRLWDYIKAKGLQDPQQKKLIRPDALLAAVFHTTNPVNMFEVPKLLGPHLT